MKTDLKKMTENELEERICAAAAELTTRGEALEKRLISGAAAGYVMFGHDVLAAYQRHQVLSSIRVYCS